MASSITDLLTRTTDSSSGRPVIASLAAPGKAIGASSISVDSATNWTTTTAIHFSIYMTVTVGVVTVKDPTTQTDWKGTLAGTTISNLTITGGTDRSYTAGAIVELTPTARWSKDLYDWGNSFANPDGSLKAAPIQTALNLGSSNLAGWNVLGANVTAVTYSGNRSYDLTLSADVTGTLSPGMRIMTTRTTAAPTQCTSLNGTTQYWSKVSPNGMTFTNNFVVSAWVKLTSYQFGHIASRYNGTSGWTFAVGSDGRLLLNGFNGGSANYSQVITYQSLPLNKWVHVTAQLDMLTFTATPTTSYMMIDGIDVPVQVLRAGTNPTALIQAGNLEIGSTNGGTNLFAGKIDQVAVFSAKVTEATMRTYISQALAGTETNLISAFSLSGATGMNDLNTTSANNLTASGAATTTTADAPFGNQAGGSISSTLDYGILQKITSTTATVQMAEGCTVPTTGAVSALSYSNVKNPYGFPGQNAKWQLIVPINTNQDKSVGLARYILTSPNGVGITAPVGSWKVKGQLWGIMTSSISQAFNEVDMIISPNTTVDITNGYPFSPLFTAFTAQAAGTEMDTPVSYLEGTYDATTATLLYVLIGSFTSNQSLVRIRSNSSVTLENAYL